VPGFEGDNSTITQRAGSIGKNP